MEMQPARPAPVGAYLAIAGAAVALGSLLLPRFTLNEEGLIRVMTELLQRVGVPGGADLQAGIAQGVATAKSTVGSELHGYDDGAIWVATRVLIGVGVIVAALKVMTGNESGLGQRSVFLGGAVAFAFRPLMYLIAPPRVSELEQLGAEFSDFLSPATGLYVALLAAFLMVGAAMMAHVGDEAEATSLVHTAMPIAPAARTGGAFAATGNPGGASAPTAPYVPSGPPMAAATPTAAYVPAGPPTPRPPASPQAPAAAHHRPAPAPRPQAAPAAFAAMAAPPGPGASGQHVDATPHRAGGSIPPPGVF